MITLHLPYIAVAEQSSHNCQRKHRPYYHIHTYIYTYIHKAVHTLEYMMYLVSGYQPQRRPETAPSRNTEQKIRTCRYKSQNYFNAFAYTVCMYVCVCMYVRVCMYVCMYVLYVCMYVFATFTGVPLQPLHITAVSEVPQPH